MVLQVYTVYCRTVSFVGEKGAMVLLFRLLCVHPKKTDTFSDDFRLIFSQYEVN